MDPGSGRARIGQNSASGGEREGVCRWGGGGGRRRDGEEEGITGDGGHTKAAAVVK